ncbi:MAG: hypothetical protein M3360_02365 [Actinomycetota bacterium]|nr:hypothetical protein [Actinomycetota bacterium]
MDMGDTQEVARPIALHDTEALVRWIALQGDALEELTSTLRDLRATQDKTIDAMRLQARVIEYLWEEIRETRAKLQSREKRSAS